MTENKTRAKRDTVDKTEHGNLTKCGHLQIVKNEVMRRTLQVTSHAHHGANKGDHIRHDVIQKGLVIGRRKR